MFPAHSTGALGPSKRHRHPSKARAAATQGEGGRNCLGSQHHDACSFKHMGHLELSILFLPKAQQLETSIANSPSCEMRRRCFSHAAHGQNTGGGEASLQVIPTGFSHLPRKKEGAVTPRSILHPEECCVRGGFLNDLTFLSGNSSSVPNQSCLSPRELAKCSKSCIRKCRSLTIT